MCLGDRYITVPPSEHTFASIKVCRYCYKGKIAVYYPHRSRMSKILCCHPKYNEPTDAKSRILSSQLLKRVHFPITSEESEFIYGENNKWTVT